MRGAQTEFQTLSLEGSLVGSESRAPKSLSLSGSLSLSTPCPSFSLGHGPRTWLVRSKQRGISLEMRPVSQVRAWRAARFPTGLQSPLGALKKRQSSPSSHMVPYKDDVLLVGSVCSTETQNSLSAVTWQGRRKALGFLPFFGGGSFFFSALYI